MTIAEKIIRAKTDYDEVYDKAKKAFGVKETVSGIGEVVLSHVNSEAHKVNAVVESKNLFDIDTMLTDVCTKVSDTEFKTNGGTASLINLPTVIGQTYTISVTITMGYRPTAVVLCIKDGENKSYGSSAETLFLKVGYSEGTVTYAGTFTAISNWVSVISVSDNLSNVQIEKSTTATDYSPYVELSGINIFEESTGASYTPSSGGTLEIDSISPTMTVYSDNPDVRIECEYYQDGSAVKEELTNTIISLGGTI